MFPSRALAVHSAREVPAPVHHGRRSLSVKERIASIKDILLNQAGLRENLRAQAAP
jgi:hypothetical protein